LPAYLVRLECAILSSGFLLPAQFEYYLGREVAFLEVVRPFSGAVLRRFLPDFVAVFQFFQRRPVEAVHVDTAVFQLFGSEGVK
jgi:hypothetical protein